MCGLTGVYGRGPQGDASELARRMSAAIAHRGPDDSGFCDLRAGSEGSGGSFAHRRLSILDLSPCGHQPMAARSGRFTIVFNGEIYNFAALRAELQREGAEFRGSSDTEVLLEGWARCGVAFLPALRGMFAFALWDEEEGRGYLVRDRFGIKPLYVATPDGAVLFASEVRAILASGVVPRRLSRAAIAGYLEHGAVPEPLSAIEGIHATPPGTVTTVEVRDGRATLGPPQRFALPLQPSGAPLLRQPGAAAAAVREALRDSVRHHLVSDVPVAMFLSGGIDSSAVVALASQETSEPLQTFTITFGDPALSEAAPASAVARRFGTEHHEIPLAGADLLAALPHALEAMDQPSLDGLNTYAVSSAVRRAGYKVVLSGLGGDELFAGYPAFARARRLAGVWARLGPARSIAHAALAAADRGGDLRRSKLRRALAGADPSRAAYLASRTLFGDRLATRLLAGAAPVLFPPAADDPPAGLSPLQRVSWFELTGYMRSTLLRDSDVFSMSHGLELRVPFVDQRVAEASAAVEDTLKLDPAVPKRLIVDALGDLLPREVWDRPKRGFELPFATWLREELRGDVERALTSPERLARVGIDAAAAARVWTDFLSGRRGVTWSRPWALFCLVRWAEEVDAFMDPPFQARAQTHSAKALVDARRPVQDEALGRPA